MPKLTDLIPDAHNANKGTQRGLTALDNSLRKYGAGRSILIDKNGKIIAGNKTQERAVDIGLDEVIIVPTDGKQLVAVQRTDLDLDTDPEARELAYYDNRVSELDLAWDVETLAMDLADGLELDGLFNEVELQELGIGPEPVNKDAEPQLDRANELQQKWQVQSGELFEIGTHRLICGDCTDAGTVARVMGGERAMVFSDAPYGVDIVKNNKVGGGNLAPTGNYAPIVGDDTTNTAHEFYNLCVSLGLSDFILWGGNYFTDFLPPSPCWIVWDKRGDMTSNNFADCELAWTSFQSPARVYKQVWAGMIREGEREKRVHPTQKPVELTMDIMQDFVSEIYFDGFGGSGTTMVACQNLARQCRMVEISPAYCAVILERMTTAFPELEVVRYPAGIQ